MRFPLLQKLIDRLDANRNHKEQIALEVLKARYHAFRIFLENNGKALELLARIDSRLIRGETDDIRELTRELVSVTTELVDGLNMLSGDGHVQLYQFHGRLTEKILATLDTLPDSQNGDYCIALDELPRNGAERAGRKAANLARLRRLYLPVPNGFVCTVTAVKRFIKTGTLTADIRRILRSVKHGQTDLNRAADRIRARVMETPLPDDLAQALEKAYHHLAFCEAENGSDPQIAISVRSSGVSEDGIQHSFAGQYTSVLNVQGVRELFVAFKEVIASGFSARAISYRMNAGMAPLDFDLAVLCQVMIPAECAGVLFTVDPAEPENERMLISAVPGLGNSAVEGTIPADLYHPHRSVISGHVFATDDTPAMSIVPLTHEETELILEDVQFRSRSNDNSIDNGIDREDSQIGLDDEEADRPLLKVEVIAHLMYYGKLLENLWGMAQDIEWAYTEDAGLTLLQTRPLQLASQGRRKIAYETTDRLMTGVRACPGKVVGCVRIARSSKDLVDLSSQSSELKERPTILVMPQSIVDASNLLPLCRGAIIDIGNPTDHLSCIAREIAMPLLTGASEASTVLKNGQWIVLDADNGSVFEAADSVISAAERAFARQQENTNSRSRQDLLTSMRSGTISSEREKLRKLTIPLNLTDAYGATFSLLECKSIHDIIRYTHEMSIMAMFNAGDMTMDFAGSLLRQLDIGVPFSFLVIDLGGGLRREQESFLRQQLAFHKPLKEEDVLSFPLKALCEGLTTSGLSYHSTPAPTAVKNIFSQTLLDRRTQRPAGSFNYALVARDYLNLNAKVEFHFAMLDAICGRDNRANYIRFRFKGGGAGMERGHRRVLFLQIVLEKNGFFTTVIGDLITASLTGASRERVYEQLIMIGRLFGYSRFLDGVMETDDTPRLLAQQFLDGRYDTREIVDTLH